MKGTPRKRIQTEQISIRIRPEQKDRLTEAATKEEDYLGPWLIKLGEQRANKVLGKKDK